MYAIPTHSNVMHKRSHSVSVNTCKALLWILFPLLSPAGLDALAEARHTLTLVFHCWQGLFQETTLKLWLLGLKASEVSLASWPTSSSTPVQTKIDSIILPSQSSKNVNKEQKLLVLHISEGLLGNRAFLKLILLQA